MMIMSNGLTVSRSTRSLNADEFHSTSVNKVAAHCPHNPTVYRKNSRDECPVSYFIVIFLWNLLLQYKEATRFMRDIVRLIINNKLVEACHKLRDLGAFHTERGN